MHKIIGRGVSPEYEPARGRPKLYPFEYMHSGDYFVVPRDSGNWKLKNLKASVRGYCRANPEAKFEIAPEQDHIRCQRLH